ncbi:sterol desaturase family protein [Maricaulis maris]|uniref:sterol desaturase family protein n=1 Tax=Maricaulis maris TaxID=74318 RepID=UPI003BAC6D41
MLIYLFTAALFTLIFTREVIAPASGASCDKRWRILAGSLNLANLGVVLAAGWLFSGWIAQYALLPMPDALPVLVQSLIIFLAASGLAYGWHRLTHASNALWRCVHQLHHSPSRIEALTAFYVHPLDSFLATLLNALVAYGVFGASPLTAALVLGYVSLFNLVAHADQRTPWWLGFILQRPEMHRLHHERHSHRSNYGLPLWDLIFGTWRNPREGTIECGFPPDREFKVHDMLLMRDVEG